ncbi:MAG: M48 family metalloprotease [Burkholderiales bacterium]|jgi:predicted Zn-dependent protease|nr:M48 family metalloprotease [Burkholderiales bacterium]
MAVPSNLFLSPCKPSHHRAGHDGGRRQKPSAWLCIWLCVALAFAPTLPLSAVAQNIYNLPELGDASREALSPTQERKLGESIIRDLRASGGYMNDPEVNDYLDTLGHKLVAAGNDSRQDFEFFAVPDPSINAFALPGGYIGVNTGLILLTQSESELASVLAHEITHVTQHHLARMASNQKDALLLSLAALAVAIAASQSNSSSSGQVIGAAVASAQALAIQTQINYTREHEYEADRIGFQRLRAAGFEVSAAAVFMTRLQRSSRFSEGSAPSYLRTHPITTERVAEAQARAENVPYKQVADSIDFHLVRALLQSYLGTPREAVAFFEDALHERKFNNKHAAHYGLAAALLRAKDYDRAKKEIAGLDKELQHPMIDAMAGHIMMESGDLDGAIARFGTAVERYPNKKQLIYDYPEALIRAGQSQKAVDFLERQIARFPGDGLLHEKTAGAYAKLKRPFKEHAHQGEYYVWLGSDHAAIEQFDLALKNDRDASFQEKSALESRKRTVQEELRERERAQKRN